MSDRLLLEPEEIDAARAAVRGSQHGVDRGGFVAGYKAALRDLSGAMTMERARIMYADIDGAANLAYDANGDDWVAPLVDEHIADARRTAQARPAEQNGPRTGWIYVLADADSPRVKIGWTSGTVGTRASGVRAASGSDLSIAGQIRGSMADERVIHARFANARIRGEWFRRTPEIDAWIASLP